VRPSAVLVCDSGGLLRMRGAQLMQRNSIDCGSSFAFLRLARPFRTLARTRRGRRTSTRTPLASWRCNRFVRHVVRLPVPQPLDLEAQSGTALRAELLLAHHPFVLEHFLHVETSGCIGIEHSEQKI